MLQLLLLGAVEPKRSSFPSVIRSMLQNTQGINERHMVTGRTVVGRNFAHSITAFPVLCLRCCRPPSTFYFSCGRAILFFPASPFPSRFFGLFV
eukprot:scaffold576_cov336-Pavlova_lutheri.AAC.18